MSRKILHRGAVVQGYQIERVLGQGGFGITYLATELGSMSSVAIKEYFPKSFASRNIGNTIRANPGNENQKIFAIGLNGFLEEAKVLARLDHPNVIKVRSIFKANGTAYFVMEYCEGESLHSPQDITNLKIQEIILKIFDGVLSGLEHVHQFGIIHGDIKPANIFLKKNQEPVLLDFGSARHELIGNFIQQVSDGYSPPELYVEKPRLGVWTDIYGVGATFYKILTGIKPPPGNERVIQDALVPCSNMSLTGYETRLLNLIDKCLSIEYHNRPKSFSEVRNVLREIPLSCMELSGKYLLFVGRQIWTT
jgi:serine/threonine protein kinase